VTGDCHLPQPLEGFPPFASSATNPSINSKNLISPILSVGNVEKDKVVVIYFVQNVERFNLWAPVVVTILNYWTCPQLLLSPPSFPDLSSVPQANFIQSR
jgi:hypothetical protein